MKYLILSLSLLLVCPVSNAIELERDQITPNRPRGYCFAACVETLGNNLKIKKLRSYVQDQVDRGGPTTLFADNCDLLDKLGVKYRVQYGKSEGTEILREAKTKGVLVAFKPGWAGNDSVCHAVIFADYDQQGRAWYYDPNTSKRHQVSWDWFYRWWDGRALVIYGQE
jgi:hypothetical protein